MTQPQRYDIGYGPLKGPDLTGSVQGANGSTALGVTQCTVGPGLPTIRGRRPGDQHVDNTNLLELTEFVLNGELGAGFQDTFDRPNSTYINDTASGVDGWVQYPAGIGDAWEIVSNTARGKGDFRMLSRPFGPVAKTVVQATLTTGTVGHPGVYAYSLDKGGQTNGYFFQVKVGSTGEVNAFIKRGGAVQHSLDTGATITVPFTLTLTVDKTIGLIAGAINGTEVITWTDPNVADATGGYVGVGTGFATSDVAHFDHFLVEEPGKNLEWLPVSGGANIEWATAPPPQVSYTASVLGTEAAGAAHGDHTHKSVQFAYEFVVVT